MERVRSATTGKGAGGLVGEAGLIGLVIIGFLTFLMLLEGPDWRHRVMQLIPQKNRSATVVFALLLVCHAIEGHTLRPLLYGRALQLSPLAVLMAILLGAEIVGFLGALAAIPIAGSIQVIIGEVLEQRIPGHHGRTLHRGDRELGNQLVDLPALTEIDGTSGNDASV